MKEIICKLFDKYKIFLMYIFSAGLSFVIDLVLFSIFSLLLKQYIYAYAIILSTFFARAISSFINYLLNGNMVFRSNNKAVENVTLVKYYILVVVQMCVSSLSVYFIYLLTNINETLIKIPVDVLIFIVNYFVQKKFIFVRKDNYEKV